MTGLLRRREFLSHRELKPRYDVVIVGGGVNGLSLAFHLAEYHGVRDVAVLERTYIGSGGSGRNTQVVRATYNTTETVPLYATSLGMYRTLSQELDFNILFSTQGNLDLCHSTDTLQVEREKVAIHRQYGVRDRDAHARPGAGGLPARRPHRRRRAPGDRRLVPPARVRSRGTTRWCGATRPPRTAAASTSTRASRSPGST